MANYIDPQQELFSRLKIDVETLGCAVYDGFLPPEGTAYPFVYLGEFRQTDDANKSAIFGNVYGTIHVWSNTPKMRGQLSNMLLDIKRICRKIEHTANFAWTVRDVKQRISADNTTKVPLMHGVLEIEFKFS